MRRKPSNGFERLIAGLNNLYSDASASHLDIDEIHALVAIGLDRELGEQLLDLVAAGSDEAGIVVCFLMQLADSEPGKGLSRHVKRLIRKAHKRNVMPTATVDAVAALVDVQVQKSVAL